jgi:hypothetical protein
VEPGKIDEKTEHLLGLLSAARTIVVANDDAGHACYSGAIALLDELERAIKRFAAELRAR